jgi:predicted NBD/HSP70 family sugar kinase
MSANAPLKSRPTAGAGRLLELVRTGRALTRLDLTRETGFARSTVGDRLELLLDAGLLTPDGTAASTGGRRPSSFAFNASAGIVLVAHFGASAGRIAVCDLNADVLAEEHHQIDIEAGPRPVLALARERFDALLGEVDRRPGEVSGVTIGVPGPVEVAAGRVIAPPIMTGWDGVDIPGALDLPYPAPVLVDNDANLMALGEHRSRAARDQHLLFIKVGTGVGSGIIAAGALHRGADGAAGDLGHIPGPGLDELCRCGLRGCIEAKVGGWALARDLRARGHDVAGLPEVVALLRARDPDAIALLREAGRILGAGVADAVSFFNPSTVVLGGDIAHADAQLLAAVREVVYARSAALATRSLRIRVSDLGERAGVIGGAHLMIEQCLAPEAVDRMLEAA